MIFAYSKQFLKDARNLTPSQVGRLKDRLELFGGRPTHSQLNNHRLKGKLKDFCSINITGDLRAIYRVIPPKLEEDEGAIRFIRIGTHSQ
jgi:addiction module RelE/StbE family toxin